MNYEEKLIHIINSVMPNSPLRKSILGEVDSEVILLGDKEYLFSTDDFSQEDLLQEHDPYILGWNIACGAVSDIIAAGGRPLVYSHTMVVPPNWDEAYIREFSKGISQVLKKYSISFIGGDLGVDENWRYTASIIGTPMGRQVNRKGCKAGDSIFLTGKIGIGNLEAVMNLYAGNEAVEKIRQGTTNRFSSHEKLPLIISKYATSAIDTSDGVFAALQTISNLNRTGFKIGNLHFHSKSILAAEALHIPLLLFFLGECGEYEILFNVSSENKDALLMEMKMLGITAFEIGEITSDSKQKTVEYKKCHFDFAEYNIRARDFKSVQDYLISMMEWVGKRGNS
jgi:thiamine-monophosphate kinase